MASIRWLLLAVLMLPFAAANGDESDKEPDCPDEERDEDGACPEVDNGGEEGGDVRSSDDDDDDEDEEAEAGKGGTKEGDGEDEDDGADDDGTKDDDGEEGGQGRSFWDPCSSNPCPEGTSCIRAGFSGYECAPNFDPCDPSPCRRGERCFRGGPRGFRCEPIVPPNPCQPNPCQSLHTCVPFTNGFRCVPPPTPSIPTGPPSPCNPNPCRNGCQCKESCRHASGYYCEKENGYLGKNCTIERPRVECYENRVVIVVNDAFVREYAMGIGNAKLFMAKNPDIQGGECLASYNGATHTFTLPLPFSSCGTEVEKIGGKTKVVNNIWLNRFTNAPYDMPVPVICFECLYTKEYSFVTSLQPTFNYPPPLRENGVVYVQGTIDLCKVGHTCPARACPQRFSLTPGAIYTVGEMVHLIIQGDADVRLVAVRNIFLSCDGQARSSRPVVHLVKDACVASSGSRMPADVTHSAQSAVACVSFQVPRLRGCTTFFIHAQMEICPPSGCRTRCGGSNGRRKRSESQPDIEDIFGPIYVITGAKGISKEILFPDESLVNVSAKIFDISSNPLPLPVVTSPAHTERGPPVYLIVLAVVVLCLFVVMVVSFVLLRGTFLKISVRK